MKLPHNIPALSPRYRASVNVFIVSSGHIFDAQEDLKAYLSITNSLITALSEVLGHGRRKQLIVIVALSAFSLFQFIMQLGSGILGMTRSSWHGDMD